MVHHRWDEHSTVQITYWNWEPQSSGTGLTPRSGRTYPMCSDLDSELYYDLAERLAKTRSQHPSFQLMEVDENLFPEARAPAGGMAWPRAARRKRPGPWRRFSRRAGAVPPKTT